MKIEAEGNIHVGGEGVRSKIEVYSRFWLENYERIPVVPWRRDKVIRMRNFIRQMRVDVIGGSEFAKTSHWKGQSNIWKR